MKRRLKILQTSDVHGTVFPYSYADHSVKNHGLSKIASAIEALRDDDTIVVDSGDLIQGSALCYYHSLMERESLNPIAIAVNHIGYDYFTPGNHDFNYGLDYLESFTNIIHAKVLANNLKKEGQLIYQPYDIIDMDGIKVGIIGTVTQHIPVWENPENIKNVTFDHAFEATARTVAEIRPKVDVLIVTYHGGFEADLETGTPGDSETGENCGYRILDEIEGIDVLLTGHQHRTLSGIKGTSIYLQPGFNGSHISMVNLELENTDGLWKILDKTATLIDVGQFSSCKELEEKLDSVENKTQLWLDEKLGYCKHGDLLIKDRLGDRLKKHPLVQMINSIQMETSGASISCTSLGNEVKGFAKQISMRDVISTYIYPNTLMVIKMTGEVLKQFLEKSAEFFTLENGEIEISKRFLEPKLELYNYEMLDGIEYTIDLRERIGQRITELTMGGKAILPENEYDVVMNNYRASGAGGFDMVKNGTVQRSPNTEIVDLIVQYIFDHKEIDIDYKDNITVLK